MFPASVLPASGSEGIISANSGTPTYYTKTSHKDTAFLWKNDDVGFGAFSSENRVYKIAFTKYQDNLAKEVAVSEVQDSHFSIIPLTINHPSNAAAWVGCIA